VADRAEALLGQRPRPYPAPSPEPAAERLVAEEDAPWHTQSSLPGLPPPTPAERLEAALRALDLDALTPREALAWLWEQREILGNTKEQDRRPSEPAAG
jgi:hypothetical protein